MNTCLDVVPGAFWINGNLGSLVKQFCLCSPEHVSNLEGTTLGGKWRLGRFRSKLEEVGSDMDVKTNFQRSLKKLGATWRLEAIFKDI